MCEVEFIWDGVFLRKVRGFFRVARSPLPNYQIADLEEFSFSNVFHQIFKVLATFFSKRQFREM